MEQAAVQNTGTGRLQFRSYTASEAYPVPDVQVTVTFSDGAQTQLSTGSTALSEAISVACPPKALSLDPESTVTGVAYKNGFPNLKSYINAFKKYYFLTPRQYILHQRKNSPEEGISPQKSKIDITIDKECL